MKQLSKRDALDWCVKHVSEWPEVKPSIAPGGWRWVPVNVAGELILVDMNRTKYIDQRGWMYHRVFGEPSFIPFKNNPSSSGLMFQPDQNTMDELNRLANGITISNESFSNTINDMLRRNPMLFGFASKGRSPRYAGQHEPSGVTFSQMMGDLCPK